MGIATTILLELGVIGWGTFSSFHTHSSYAPDLCSQI